MSHGCTKCMKKPKCTCKRVWEPEYEVGCTEKIDAKCVIYRPEGGSSLIKNFLNITSRTSLEVILEEFDNKLSNLFVLELSQCGKSMLTLPDVTNVKTALLKLIDHVCGIEDQKVKTSTSDSSTGYLFEKISTGECVKKAIRQDNLGRQSVEVYLDFECIAAKLPTVIEVNCCNQNFSIESNITEICNSSLATLTAFNCSDTVVWYKNGVIMGTGNSYVGNVGTYYAKCGNIQSNTITITACQCTPVWTDKLPVEIFCGEVLSLDPCKMYIKQVNQCNQNFQWVQYLGSGSENASECNGCVSGTTYTANRTADFTRNNCSSGCTAGIVSFSRNYTSNVSQQDADNQKAAGLTAFNADGQAYANSTGGCTSCPGCTNTTWTLSAPLVTDCQNNVIVNLEESNCGDTRWNPTSTACNVTTTYTATASQSFQRNNCGSGCTSGSSTYSQDYVSNVSQNAANALMAAGAAQFAIDGQAYANAHATCTNCPTTYYNTEQSFTEYRTFTKNNCAVNETGSAEQVAHYEVVAAGNVTSTVSQNAANADALALATANAIAWMNTNGQALANTQGTCTPTNVDPLVSVYEPCNNPGTYFYSTTITGAKASDNNSECYNRIDTGILLSVATTNYSPLEAPAGFIASSCQCL